jgi:hypothetical protein
MDKPIVLTGIKETLTALEAFDKQAVKAFNKVINTELGNAKQSAIGMLPTNPPMSGWRTIEPFKPTGTRGGAGWPAWDYSKIVSGIGVTKAERKVRRDYTTSAGSLRNAYSSGAIFEVAGRRSNGVGRGTQFIQNLNRFGRASRLIWSVVDRDGYKIRANVSAALDEAKKKLQTALNSQRS